MFGLGPLEVVVIGAIAVMLYGKRLPEVGRTFGRTVGELRRQWTSLATELESATHIDVASARRTGGSRAAGNHLARSGGAVSGSRAVRSSGAGGDGTPLTAGPRFEPPGAEASGSSSAASDSEAS